jgi:hypothetical protein
MFNHCFTTGTRLASASLLALSATSDFISMQTRGCYLCEVGLVYYTTSGSIGVDLSTSTA